MLRREEEVVPAEAVGGIITPSLVLNNI